MTRPQSTRKNNNGSTCASHLTCRIYCDVYLTLVMVPSFRLKMARESMEQVNDALRTYLKTMQVRCGVVNVEGCAGYTSSCCCWKQQDCVQAAINVATHLGAASQLSHAAGHPVS